MVLCSRGLLYLCGVGFALLPNLSLVVSPLLWIVLFDWVAIDRGLGCPQLLYYILTRNSCEVIAFALEQWWSALPAQKLSRQWGPSPKRLISRSLSAGHLCHLGALAHLASRLDWPARSLEIRSASWPHYPNNGNRSIRHSGLDFATWTWPYRSVTGVAVSIPGPSTWLLCSAVVYALVDWSIASGALSAFVLLARLCSFPWPKHVS